jgi:hypothetical protein
MAGQGGFAHGMTSMLVVPSHGLVQLASPSMRPIDGTHVTILGIASSENATDTCHGRIVMTLDVRKLPPGYGNLTTRPATIMAKPVCLPAWSTYPARGVHEGWESLQATESSTASTIAQWIVQIAAVRLDECLQIVQEKRFVSGECLASLRLSLARLEVQLAQDLMNRFCDGLNTFVAQGCLAVRGAIYPAEYNWVANGASARQWQWRMDALQVVPALCTSAVQQAIPIHVDPELARQSAALRRLKNWADATPIDGAITIAQVIDNALPLFAHLAQSFCVKPATIRILRGIPPQYGEVLAHPPCGWQHLLQTLDAIAPEQLPRSRDDWYAFSALYEEILHVQLALDSLHRVAADHFLKNVARTWLAGKARNWPSALEKWRDAYRRAQSLALAPAFVYDVKQYTKVLDLDQGRRYALAKRLAGYTPAKWQGVMESYEEEQILPDKTNTTSLASGTADPRPNNLYVADLPVRRLVNLTELKNEGAFMRHCIATHYYGLAMRRELAFAIGTDDTLDRSTLKVVYDRQGLHGWRVKASGHRASRNGAPSQKCVQAGQELVRLLASPAYQSFLNLADLRRIERNASKARTSQQLEAEREMDVTIDAAARAERVLKRLGLLQEC